MNKAQDRFAKLDELHGERSEIDKALGLSGPEAITEWLIAAHGLSPEARRTVEINLEQDYRKAAVKGSLVPIVGTDFEIRVFGILVLTIKRLNLGKQ